MALQHAIDSLNGETAEREPGRSGPEAEDIGVGKRVLKLEAESLAVLGDSLGADFAAAVEILHKVSGRVIVTGMGKSGHIACKLAATLASTGTPSFFVHPGEASHGDLGMITAQDAVVALSNSGNTPELADIIAYTRRFGIPLVAIVGREKSVLTERADVGLLLPRMPEACPMGLAPTTSTTMALALGDALAVALLERRGFSPEDFQVFHPGGALGKKLSKVSEIMHGAEELPLCEPGTAMSEAIIVMSATTFGCVGVKDEEGELIGIITDGDLRRHMSDGLLSRTAAEVMTEGPQTIRPNALAAEALRLMDSRKITSLFVVEDRKPVGFLRMHDLLRAGVA